MSSPKAVPISALPLPPSTHVLTRNLTPDPAVPSPSDFGITLRETPSVQRRSRMLAANAHFSYVAPCPLQFPFRVEPPEDGSHVEDKAAYVEKWLSQREALQERPLAASAVPGVLKKYYAKKRDEPRVLVALAETALKDCLPHLDVGDAFSTLGTPSLSDAHGDDAKPESASDEAIDMRQELIDVLGGQAVLMNLGGEPEATWAPWSLRYSGHQFGAWAGQLGDGRAISILSTPHPSDPDTTYELQLKGSGRTPFSRFADGLAVLRSSIREFLCSEAMHALGIPTSRALALVQLPALPVQRERSETACILTRLAPSFIRIGSFEALSPPHTGVSQQDPDWDALRILGEYVGKRVLKLEGVDWGGEGEGSKWGEKLVLESARRNGKMVAGWQAYGFMHGVINTDNVSIMGITIDYGPYAFMDMFDPWHICNHDDGNGRYGYKWQPNAIIFALRQLVNALAPLIGAEAELGRAVSPGWAAADESKIDEWRERGSESVREEMERVAQEACAQEYGRLMHLRLGLHRHDASDEAELCRPLLDLMAEHKLDFHGTFRTLCAFRCSTDEVQRNLLIDRLIGQCATPHNLDMAKAFDDWEVWLAKYLVRVESERGLWGGGIDEVRTQEMRGANPRFVLRQWVLEEVIRNVERDVDSGKRLLAKVLQMACNPFDTWGAEDKEDDSTLDAEQREERRYCSIGEMDLLGYQCSCSS